MQTADVKANNSLDVEILDYIVSDTVGHDEWQEIADNCSYATFFHTPQWYSAFEKTVSGLCVSTKRFTFADGKNAVLPLMEQNTSMGLHGNYLSGPAGNYGGWISSDHLEPQHATAIKRWLLDGRRSVFWRLNPYDGLTPMLAPYVTTADTTEVLHLVDVRNEDQLRQTYKRSVRKEINKAKRTNITVGLADGWDHWVRYFELYQENLRRWGDKATSSYPVDLFRYFYECERRNVRLWLAFDDKKIVGGNLNFYQSRHCVEWHASFDHDYFGLGVRNLLVDSIVVDAMLQGYHFYDFNPSGGHEGTRKFKQSFGSIQKFADIVRVDKKPYVLKKLGQISALLR